MQYKGDGKRAAAYNLLPSRPFNGTRTNFSVQNVTKKVWHGN